jgi:hypothetical protein
MKSQKSANFLTWAIFLATVFLKQDFVESTTTSNENF